MSDNVAWKDDACTIAWLREVLGDNGIALTFIECEELENDTFFGATEHAGAGYHQVIRSDKSVIGSGLTAPDALHDAYEKTKTHLVATGKRSRKDVNQAFIEILEAGRDKSAPKKSFILEGMKRPSIFARGDDE